MTKEQAMFLVKATEDCGNQDITVYATYSGRGMFGQETHAVSVRSFSQLFSDVLEFVNNNIVKRFDLINSNVSVNVIDITIPQFSSLRQDSMGRDSIVIY